MYLSRGDILHAQQSAWWRRLVVEADNQSIQRSGQTLIDDHKVPKPEIGFNLACAVWRPTSTRWQNQCQHL